MLGRLFFILCIFFIFVVLSQLSKAQFVHDVVSLGAIADGSTDSAPAFLSAWNLACKSPQYSIISIPQGNFLLTETTFKGPCLSPITINLTGTLIAGDHFRPARDRWIIFNGVRRLSLHGGTLDGSGAAVYSCKASNLSCPAGATSLTLFNSEDVIISGLTSVNSELYHVVIHGCRRVRVQGLRVFAPASSPNTDGVHVQKSAGVVISGADIQTGDDCVSVGDGAADLVIDKVNCGPGHGISIGSLGKAYEEEGVRNVTVTWVVFNGTTNGLRIKSWARPSTGFVHGVFFRHVLMRDVENPIIIDQNYCPHRVDCPDEDSGVKISEVCFEDIKGSSATPVAVNFACSRRSPCMGILLQDVKLTYGDGPAKAACQHVNGTSSGVMAPPSCF